MPDPPPAVTRHRSPICFARDRLDAFLKRLEVMAAGRLDARLPLSPRSDPLDAIASGINVLAGALAQASARAHEADETVAALRAAVARGEARHAALLTAIPDSIFVLRRDGTYVDCHVRDPQTLSIPPSAFIGKTVRDLLPPAPAEVLLQALARACEQDEPVVVEYELPIDGPRSYEARIVQLGTDHLLSIVRDVTEATHVSEGHRELTQRLIARQEIERQRIARELHDDISQRIALMNVELDDIATQIHLAPLRLRLRRLHAQAGEIATDLHQLSYELHPLRLRSLGLVGAVASLCRDISHQRHLRVAFTHRAIPRALDGTVSLCLYRIVQEALHNVVRHSHASEAQVHLSCDGQQVALEIADAGRGFHFTDVQQTGLGLVSMRERAVILNGHLAIDAVPGRGTRVAVRIPLGSPASSAAPSFAAST